MPLVDSNDVAVWNSLYSCVLDGRTAHFERAARQQYMGRDGETLIAALVGVGLQKGQRIALIGAGFGWLAEEFVAAGYGPIADGTANGKVCAVDTSTWIQANKAGNATVAIVNADVNGSTGRRTVKQQFGSNNAVIDWAISEDVLPILSDAECGVFASALRQVATNVAHWVSLGIRRFDNSNVWAGDARLNWKTLEAWKALVTLDRVIARNDQGRML